MNEFSARWLMGLGAALFGVVASCGGGNSRGAGAGGTAGTVGQGGTSGTGAGVGTGGAVGGSGGGISNDGGPINTGGGQLLPFIGNSAGITVAIDGSGALHVAALTDVDGKTTAVYARCAGQCDQEASWTSVALAEADVAFPPTIGVTADGRPRVMWSQAFGTTGFFYAECDGACDNVASWKSVQLTQGPNTTAIIPPKIPFAISPSGSAVFAHADNPGSFIYYCKTGCANPGAWSSIQVGDAYLVPESVAFAPDETPHVVAQHYIQQDVQLAWLACVGDCANPQSWNGLDGLWITHNNSSAIDAVVALTPQAGPRIGIYADDPNTASTEKVYALASCDTDCMTPGNWSTVTAPLPPDSNDRGFDMILDGAGRPTFAYVGNTTVGFTSCTGDCSSGAGWQPLAGIESGVLDNGLPFRIPNDCSQGYWMMQTGPSLALTPDGKLAIAFTGSERASGGTCGTDTFIAAQSFLVLP